MEMTTVLIVKDELKNLEILLPVLNEFSDELVLVDTGSHDNTEDFINSLDFRKKIIFKKIKWNDNFSTARNESLKLATKDFVFWLDADDRLEKKEVAKISELKKDLRKDRIYSLKIVNEADSTLSYQLKIFPNKKDIRFKYRVHEQLDFKRELFKIVFIDITIKHTGYNDKMLLRKKQLRNLKILHRCRKKDFYVLLQIAESYKMLRDYENAETYLKKALEKKDCESNDELIGFAFLELFKISIFLKKFENALNALHEAESYAEAFPVVNYFIGREFFRENDFDKAETYLSKFTEKHKNKIYFNPVPLRMEESAKFFLAKTYLYKGKREKALKIINELLETDSENRSYQNLKEKIIGE